MGRPETILAIRPPAGRPTRQNPAGRPETGATADVHRDRTVPPRPDWSDPMTNGPTRDQPGRPETQTGPDPSPDGRPRQLAARPTRPKPYGPTRPDRPTCHPRTGHRRRPEPERAGRPRPDRPPRPVTAVPDTRRADRETRRGCRCTRDQTARPGDPRPARGRPAGRPETILLERRPDTAPETGRPPRHQRAVPETRTGRPETRRADPRTRRPTRRPLQADRPTGRADQTGRADPRPDGHLPADRDQNGDRTPPPAGPTETMTGRPDDRRATCPCRPDRTGRPRTRRPTGRVSTRQTVRATLSGRAIPLGHTQTYGPQRPDRNRGPHGQGHGPIIIFFSLSFRIQRIVTSIHLNILSMPPL
ncbi:hypothetical protein FKM82_007762 [Ascaphus truei]